MSERAPRTNSDTFALIQRIASRYGITEDEATQIRLGILRGELPNLWEA